MRNIMGKAMVQSEIEHKAVDYKKIAGFLFALLIFLALYFGLPDSFNGSARVMIAIVCFGVSLWALEPIPLGLTAVFVLLLMLLFQVADSSVIYSGFASPAIFLIIAGMMLARAVNDTPLAKRIAYKIIKRWGGSSKGLLGSILIIPQIQAFFIPATAVRTTLLLPIALLIIDTVKAKPGSNLRKLILLGVAFGGNISGTAVMTAAIGNILTVELLNRYAGIKITYFEWLYYTFPLWLILIVSMWFLLLKMCPLPKDQQSFPDLKQEMERRLAELGPISLEEIKCLIILLSVVTLWITEPLHGLHPCIPAFIGVFVMTLPGIGCASWEDVVKVNYNTVILLSVTLSMGYALIDSGAATIVGQYLSVDWIITIVQRPFAAVIFIVLLTQIFHKFISNVSTAVVTLIPIVISLASSANVDPMMLCFTAGLTSLYGFLFVIETMPNLLVHGTGLISQSEFFRPGIFATGLTIIATLLIAFTWWQFIGLV